METIGSFAEELEKLTCRMKFGLYNAMKIRP